MSAFARVTATLSALLVVVAGPAISAAIDGYRQSTPTAGTDTADSLPSSAGQGWTAIGATGTPDESDASKIAFYNDGSVGIRSSIDGASAKIRFNVVATRDVSERLVGLEVPGEPPYYTPLELSAVVRDNGPHARVIVTLKRIAMYASGSATTTLSMIDSDQGTASSGYVRRWAWLSDGGRRIRQLSFYEDAFFVEVQLIKSTREGDPRLRVATILHGPCC